MSDAGVLGVGWSGIVGGVVGCAAAVGALVWFHRRREREKEERNERPPQTENILRPAGYSAQQKLVELSEKIDVSLLQMLGASLMGGMVFGAFFPVVWGLAIGRFRVAELGGLRNASVLVAGFCLGAIGVLWAVREFAIAARLYDEVRNWRFGLRGEQAVAEKLADRGLAAAGYVVFHDLPAEKGKKKWNVDHVVVGPGGVFVLETKARPKRRATRDQKESDVIFDGESLQFPWCVDWDVVGQVQSNAEWVEEQIKAFAPEGILVQPVIVVPGWWVESKGNYQVKAMNATYLVGYLTGTKRVYEPRDLKGVVKKLDEVCRGLEF